MLFSALLPGQHPQMANPSFFLRPTTPADAPALNDLYQRLTGKARTLDAWRWQWHEGPGGPAPSHVLIDPTTQRVIGHQGVIPVKLHVGGCSVPAARTENTMLDPDYRKQLYWPAFEKQLLREFEQQFDVLFTCAGKGAPAVVRRRMGYKPVAAWETHQLAVTPAHWATRKLGSLGRTAQVLGGLSLPRPPAGWELEETRDLTRIARLWEAVRGDYPLAAERDAATLDWRFARHPFHNYSLSLLRRAGRDEGFVATWSESRRGGAVRIWIEDIFVAGNDEASYQAAFQHLAWRHRREPASLQLRTVALDRPLRRAATSLPAGWMGAPATVGENEAQLLARGDAAPFDGPWDVTMIVDQGRHVASGAGR